MKRCLVAAVIAILAFSLTAVVHVPKAMALGLEWSQTDWSGGPGQALWKDEKTYHASFRVDVMGKSGVMRLSYLASRYTKAAANPVIKAGPAGSWDDAMAFGLPVSRSKGGYYCFYVGAGAATSPAVGYATSSDGVNWKKYSGNPVIRKSGAEAWDQSGVFPGNVYRVDGTYHMFFHGLDAASTSFSIGHATSNDRVTWDRAKDPVLSPGAGSWEESLLGMTINQRGRCFECWYRARDAGGVERIGYASSADGYVWTKSAANPVLQPGPAGSWDAGGTTGARVIERQLTGDYLMVYSARDGLGGTGVGVATSPDGVTWTKHPANPVFSGAGAAWTQNRLQAIDLGFDGSIYKLSLFGVDAANLERTGEAWSHDGLVWQMNALNPLLSPSPAPAWDDWSVNGYLPHLQDGAARCFYTGTSTVGTPSTGTATTAPAYAETGELVSSVYDAQATAEWGRVDWKETKPAGTDVKVFLRGGDTREPGGSWTAWTEATKGDKVPVPESRYIQYRVRLATTAQAVTPEVSEVSVSVRPKPTWYLAEGSTGSDERGSFETWVLVQNPTGEEAHADIYYQTPDGEVEGPRLTLEPRTRRTVNVGETVPDEWSVSTRVVADNVVIAERAMYWNSADGTYRQAAHGSIGVLQPAEVWFLAEGSTGTNDYGTFETWVLIQNPGDDVADVDIYYQTPEGETPGPHLTLAPRTRQTIKVSETVPNRFSVSTRVESDTPVIAERAMYWNTLGGVYRQAAHGSVGVTEASQTWYLAEGSTGSSDQGSFETWILVQNPGDEEAVARLYYQTPDGEIEGQEVILAPRSRETRNVADLVPNQFSVSTRVAADRPVIAERAMYWSSAAGVVRQAAHDSIGVPEPGDTWYLAEGSTGTSEFGTFETWVLVQNPTGSTAHVRLYYQTPEGETPGPRLTLAPFTRRTVSVGETVPGRFSVSTRVVADSPVIAERAMYWTSADGTYRQAAHDSIGVDP